MASGDSVYVFAERFHKAHWVRNIMKTPRVHVRLAGQTREATAAVLDAEHDAVEWQAVQGLASEKYGWGDGLPVRLTPDTPF